MDEKISKDRKGISPQDFVGLITIGTYHFENGAKKFTEWSVKMIETLDDRVKPHLQSVYDEIITREKLKSGSKRISNLFLLSSDYLCKFFGLSLTPGLFFTLAGSVTAGFIIPAIIIFAVLLSDNWAWYYDMLEIWWSVLLPFSVGLWIIYSTIRWVIIPISRWAAKSFRDV